jgi:hypothetical protein
MNGRNLLIGSTKGTFILGQTQYVYTISVARSYHDCDAFLCSSKGLTVNWYVVPLDFVSLFWGGLIEVDSFFVPLQRKPTTISSNL